MLNFQKSDECRVTIYQFLRLIAEHPLLGLGQVKMRGSVSCNWCAEGRVSQPWPSFFEYSSVNEMKCREVFDPFCAYLCSQTNNKQTKTKIQ